MRLIFLLLIIGNGCVNVRQRAGSDSIPANIGQAAPSNTCPDDNSSGKSLEFRWLYRSWKPRD